MTNRRVLPLPMVPPNTTVRIVDVVGGRSRLRRIFEMGLTPGVIAFVRNNDIGPIILEVRGVVLAIGRGLAKSILVEVL